MIKVIPILDLHHRIRRLQKLICISDSLKEFQEKIVPGMMTNEKPARPDEVPFYPEKPEITPGEPEPAVWPKKDPEIIPGKEPERQSPPKEIPPPPESIDKN